MDMNRIQPQLSTINTAENAPSLEKNTGSFSDHTILSENITPKVEGLMNQLANTNISSQDDGIDQNISAKTGRNPQTGATIKIKAS